MAKEPTEQEKAQDAQKAAAVKAMAAKLRGESPAPDPVPAPEDKHRQELTAQFKKDNPEKSDEEIGTLVTAKVAEGVKQKELLTTKLAEIKARPENKDKKDEEINTILKEELSKTKSPEKQKTLNELLSEHTQGTFADIQALLAKANEPKEQFANDQIKHLNELAKNGTDILDVLKYQSLGLDKLDPANIDEAKELIKQELRLSKPGISEKELELEIKFSYPLELKKETYEDEDGEKKERVLNAEEVELTKLKLTRNARVAKETLIKKEKELTLPKNFNKEANQKLKEQWDSRVNDFTKDTTNVTFEINENDKFTYVIKNKDVLNKTMKEADSFLSRYVKNGQTDMKRYQQDMLAINEMDNIVKSAYEQGKSVGYESAVNNISNLGVETNGGSPNYVPQTPAQVMSKKFKAEIGGY